MEPPKAASLRNQIDALRFAESDMKAAEAAANAIPPIRDAGQVHLAHALLTGMVVCYARPYTESNQVPALPKKLLPLREQRSGPTTTC